MKSPTLFLLLLISAFSLNANAISAPPDASNTTNNPAVAYFAGGCFWCMEPPFDKLEGVLKTTSGYIGGQTDKPTYKQVSAGYTGHTEAIEVIYNADKVNYNTLLKTFWQNIDPLDSKGQFCDKGSQYRSEIFVVNPQQQQLAQQSLEALKRDIFPNQTIATGLSPATTFYAAEDYHQDYYQRNPLRYKYYRSRCGRDKRLAELWQNPDGSAKLK